MNKKTLAILIKAEDDASKTLKSVEGNFEKVTSNIAKYAKVAAAAGAAATVAITTAAVKSTAALEQSLGGSEVVFGEYHKEIQQLARDSAKVMGTSQNQYLETANKMGSLFQGAGFDVKKSMDLTSSAMQRATDVATAMGIDTSMALESIAGAAKGNFTMMDNLGVAMNDTTLEAYRLEKGIKKSVGTMTNAEKVGLAMQLFMERTAKYAGNYAKENDTLAGSFQTLKGAWGNFLSGVDGSGEQISRALSNMVKVLGRELPVIFNNLVREAGNLYQDLRRTNPEFKRFTDMVSAGASAIKSLVPYMITATSALVGYKVAIMAVNTVQKAQALYATATATQYIMLNGVLTTVRTATVAQTIAQAALNTAMKFSPVGLVTAAVIGITTAYIQARQQTDNTKAATDRLNQARREEVQAADAAKDANNRLKDAQLNVEGSALAVERAQLSYNDAIRQYGPNSLEAREAAFGLKRAQDDLAAANANVRDRTNEAREAQEKLKSTKDAIIAANNQIAGSAWGAADGYKALTQRVAEAQEATKKAGGGGVSPIKSLVPSIGGGMPGHADGGFTGRGDKYDVAGLVHRGEYVVPKEQVDQTTGKPKAGVLGSGQTFNMYGNVILESASAVDRYYERFMGTMDMKQSLGEYGAGT